MQGSTYYFANENPQDLAGYGQRLVARLIDNLVGTAVFMPGLFLGAIPGFLNDKTEFSVFGLVLCALSVIYSLVANAFNGQSIGKRVMKIVVIDVYDGERCSLIQSIGRNLSTVLGLLDVILIFFGSRRRLGDYFAGTMVVRA